MDAKEFGEFLRSLRDDKKITLTELGNRIGYSNPYLSQIETGKKGIPSPKLLKLLSKELGISYRSLLIKAGHLEESDEAVSLTDADIIEDADMILKSMNIKKIDEGKIPNVSKYSTSKYPNRVFELDEVFSAEALVKVDGDLVEGRYLTLEEKEKILEVIKIIIK